MCRQRRSSRSSHGPRWYRGALRSPKRSMVVGSRIKTISTSPGLDDVRAFIGVDGCDRGMNLTSKKQRSVIVARVVSGVACE